MKVSNRLMPGEILERGDRIESPKRKYKFQFQEDGNLVFLDIRGEKPISIWSTRTNRKNGKTCQMQHDGNFVVFNAEGKDIWSSRTHGNPGAYLEVQDDKRLLIYKPIVHKNMLDCQKCKKG